MNKTETQPRVSVGLLNGIESARFELKGEFATENGTHYDAGAYLVEAANHQIKIGEITIHDLCLSPVSAQASFIIHDVVIGIDFHWERKQDQEFKGALRIKVDVSGRLIIINEVTVETYLTSVISSEMSASAHPELLKAHAIISRSWLLAQVEPWKKNRRKPSFNIEELGGSKQLIRWYDRENHTDFDVCADDHCQRYQGITNAISQIVLESVTETTGRVLVHRNELCDSRYSKSCGGMTECFDAAWEDVKVPYLQVLYDGEAFPPRFSLPLTIEANAVEWIRNSPSAFCNTNDGKVLGKILPSFDQETTDFFRWRVTIEQEELRELLHRKLGLDIGFIRKLEPVKRGGSGRIIRLRITGDRETIVIGKELEIRRALSPSHLYSSAFVVDSDERSVRFDLIGAGWGHGVGLCQIGAAMMAEQGSSHHQILQHYYRGAEVFVLYE